MADEGFVLAGTGGFAGDLDLSADGIGGEVPVQIGLGLAGIAAGFGEVADELGPRFIVRLRILQFQNPGAGILTLTVAAHLVIPPGVVDDDDGDLGPPQLQQPLVDALVIVAFVFIHADGQG